MSCLQCMMTAVPKLSIETCQQASLTFRHVQELRSAFFSALPKHQPHSVSVNEQSYHERVTQRQCQCICNQRKLGAEYAMQSLYHIDPHPRQDAAHSLPTPPGWVTYSLHDSIDRGVPHEGLADGHRTGDSLYRCAEFHTLAQILYNTILCQSARTFGTPQVQGCIFLLCCGYPNIRSAGSSKL